MRAASTPVHLLLAAVVVLAGACGELRASAKEGDRDSGPSDGLVRMSISQDPPDPVYVGASIKLTARVTDYVAKKFNWVVQDPDDELVKEVRTLAGDGRFSTISFTANLPGTYSVRCTAIVFNNEASERASVSVTDPGVPKRRYRIRISPPPSSTDAEKELFIDMAGADLRDQTVTLEKALQQEISVLWDGQAVDTQLRIYSLHGEDPAPRDEFLPAGHQMLALPSSFRALFIPLTALAPSLVKRVDSVIDLGSSWKVIAGAGAPVTGTVLRGGSSPPVPLAGASVSMTVMAENLDAPSTLGFSDAGGKFSLLARPGQSATFTVAPPQKTGLPVGVASDLTVPLTGSSNWSFTYNSIAVSTLAAKLSRSGGGAASPGALVVLSRSDAVEVGKLDLAGKSLVSAKGRYRYTLTSDASGDLHEVASGSNQLGLPAGTYTAEMWPAKDEAVDQGYRSTTAVLSSGLRSGPLQLALGRRVSLTGTVAGGLASAAQLQVIATAAPERTFVGSVNGSGFTLLVDDKSTYTLTARAVGSSKRIGSLTTQVAVDGDKTLAELRLPRAVLYSGWVKTSSNMAVRGALIRAWCADPACPAKELVDETRSLADGSFVLRIPARAGAP